MAKLLYQGHGSFRITSGNGVVIYVDPYVGEGYDAPADVILVSHQHGDHSQTHLPSKKPNCRIITEADALAGGQHNTFAVDADENIKIASVEASNKNHDPLCSVGFIIEVDGIKIYASGDTSKTSQMDTFAALNLDYALLCCDGVYNMDTAEAAECARIIGATHNIPIHMKPGSLFDMATAERFDAPGRLILEPGTEIELK